MFDPCFSDTSPAIAKQTPCFEVWILHFRERLGRISFQVPMGAERMISPCPFCGSSVTKSWKRNLTPNFHLNQWSMWWATWWRSQTSLKSPIPSSIGRAPKVANTTSFNGFQTPLCSNFWCGSGKTVFSTGGDISIKTQNCLSQKLKQLLFLNKHLCILYFEYSGSSIIRTRRDRAHSG